MVLTGDDAGHQRQLIQPQRSPGLTDVILATLAVVGQGLRRQSKLQNAADASAQEEIDGDGFEGGIV